MRTYAQERPENPYERGILQLVDGSSRWAGQNVIGRGETVTSSVVKSFEPATAPFIGQATGVGFGVPINEYGTKQLPDFVIMVRSSSKDQSLIVAEAKAAANSPDPSAQSYFDLTSTVDRDLRFFFFAGREQAFEDGIESEFSQNFVRIVTRYKTMALDSVQNLVESNSINAEILAEALRWLPRIQDPSTYNQRLSLITRCLFLPWARVRDAATLALTSLADKSAITALKKAIEREPVEELRSDMEQASNYLESISGATSS